MFGNEPLETLFERTTSGGMVLRAQMGQTWDPPTGGDFGAGGWQPPPWCFESGQLRVSLAGNGAVDVGGSGWYREPFKGRSVSWMMLGGADSQPHWVVVAQVPAGATNVAVTFADGATDSVEPQNGIAVLAVAAAPGAAPDDMNSPMPVPPAFEVTFEGGSEPLSVTSGDVGTWADPEFQESCSPPPPALPDPGEQPADPALAEAQIVDVMTRLYDGTVTGEDGLVDDNTGIADARAQVAEGSFSAEASSAQADDRGAGVHIADRGVVPVPRRHRWRGSQRPVRHRQVHRRRLAGHARHGLPGPLDGRRRLWRRLADGATAEHADRACGPSGMSEPAVGD